MWAWFRGDVIHVQNTPNPDGVYIENGERLWNNPEYAMYGSTYILPGTVGYELIKERIENG